MTSHPRAWGPAVAWGAALWVASSRPTLPASLDSGLDKLAHFLAFAVLGGLLARVRQDGAPRVSVLLALGLLYALIDELHQAFVPGRTPSLGDWIADALGVGAGLALYLHFREPSANRPTRGGPRLTDSMTR